MKNQKGNAELGVILLVGLVCSLLFASGCSTGGYLQIGYIPVNEVDDRHMNKQEYYDGNRQMVKR